MTKETAETIIENYEYEIWWKFKHGNDHPSEYETHQERLDTLRAKLIRALMNELHPAM